MITNRLDSHDPASFALYPLFERRVLSFAERYLHLPLDQLRDQTLQRWVNSPLAAGYWLGLDDDGQAVAHILAYLAYDDFKRPRIECWQLEADDGNLVFPLMRTVSAQFIAWVRSVNLAFEASGSSQRVTEGYLCTWHDPATMKRFMAMAGLHFDEERVVMRCSFAPEEATNGRSVTAK